MEKINFNGQDVYMNQQSFCYLMGFYQGRIDCLIEFSKTFEKNLNFKTNISEIVNSLTSGIQYKTDSAGFKQ